MTLKKIEPWLKARGFQLSLVPLHNDICFNKKRVRVCPKQRPFAQIVSALHECGHLLIYLCRKKLETRVVAGTSFKTWWKLQKSNSKNSQLLCIQEEMTAWDRGVRLAKRLNIHLNKRELQFQRTRSLLSYVRSTAKGRNS